MTDLEALDFENFAGGMADIDTPNDRKKAEILENYDITNTNQARTRAGSEILDSTSSLISTSSGGVRESGQTGSVLNYDDDLHVILRSKQSLYAKNAATWDASTAWTKIAGPNTGFESLPSVASLTAHLVVSSVNWYNHQILVGKDESLGKYINPQKAYLNSSNTFKVLNAGLPKPCNPVGFVHYTSALSEYILIANALKSSLNTHMADSSGDHAQLTSTITSSDATDLDSLITLTEEMIFAYNKHANMDPNNQSGVAGYQAHRISQMAANFGFDATKVTVALNYLVPYAERPQTLTEVSSVLDNLYWTYCLHLMAFMDPPDTLASATWPTGAGSTVTWSTGNDTATFTGVESFRTGDPVIFTGGTAPGGITLGTIYYAIKTDSTHIKLAATASDATVGVNIDITAGAAGTTTVIKYHTPLHPLNTAGFPTTYYSDGQIASGFRILPNDGTTSGYPWLNYTFTAEVQTLLTNLVTHMTSSKHGSVTTGGTSYMSSYATLNPGSVTNTDWGFFGAVIRAYAAYRVHVAQNDGMVHVAATTESAGNVPTVTKMNYTKKYAYNPKDSATWTMLMTLIDDIDAKFVAHAGDAARHVGGATTFSAAVGTYEWSQRQYALVLSHSYKTYNGLTFEEKSAPNFSQSMALCHQVGAAYGFTPYKYSVMIQAPMDFAFENYDDSNINLEVYRTKDGETDLFLAYQANYKKDFPTTYSIITAIDETDDTTLEDNNILLYTTGGVVGRDPAPRCKSAHRLGDYVAYLGIVEEDLATLSSLSFANGFNSSTISLVANGLTNGDAVAFAHRLAGPLGGIERGKVYYVVNAATDTFSVAAYPGGSAITITNGTGATVSGSLGRQVLKERKNRLRQSFPGIAFSSPESFYIDLESDGIQVGSAQEKYVVVCKTGVYRIDGRFTETGQGGMLREKISDRVGGVSALGGISVNDLFFFLGQDGFYMTDAYKVYPITKHLKTSVAAAIDQDRNTFSARNNLIQCVHNRQDNTIVWSFDPGSVGYATETWTLYLNHFSLEGGAVFTKQKNDVHYRPTALGYFRGQLIRGDYQGFVFKHSSSKVNDPYINTASTGSLVSGRAAHIPFKLRSLPEDFGNRGTRKIVAKALLQFTNQGNFTCALKSINEKNTSNASSMKGIRFRQEYTGNIKEKRTFPVGTSGTKFQGTRCHLKQIQLEPDTTAILYGSDDYALGTVVTNVMTLASGSWPTPDGGLVGMSIYTEVDSYATGYVITAVSGANLTATSLPDMTGKKWVIKGAPRDEKHEILAYTLYAKQVESQPMPPSGDSGANA